MNHNKVALIILDGWGIGDRSVADAIAHADTPVMNKLLTSYPSATLITSGEDVGLPAGQMGNSEVGHLNIGAGRVVYQDLVRINLAIRDGSFFSHQLLNQLLELRKKRNATLHVMGLLSDGGVHSHLDHLKAICSKASSDPDTRVRIHAFSDGRDTDPKAGLEYMLNLQQHLDALKGNIRVASVCGRYYAMDRDKRWERVARAYHLLVNGKGIRYERAQDVFTTSYAKGVTDEFIEPALVGKEDNLIRDNDIVLCFNFRTDRCREILEALTMTAFPEHEMAPLNLSCYTMTRYDERFKHISVLYEKDNLSNTLGEVVSAAGLSQLRIAETEKYPHVTFFFSGGREEPFQKEWRIMIPSPKVATYDLQPEMSAGEVAAAAIESIEADGPDFICLNFANPDMVGHTGVPAAVKKAVEVVDECLGKVLAAAHRHGYACLVIADHGNADKIINEDGSPNTAHTTNPVPVICTNSNRKVLHHGRLADVAPTILDLMNLPQPPEMMGISLFVEKLNSSV